MILVAHSILQVRCCSISLRKRPSNSNQYTALENEETMMVLGRSSLMVCILVLINIFVTSSFNFNAKIMSLTTKRIAAAAFVAVGLTGLPDQILSFSPASYAQAQETKSIFDGMYNDPNHPGCMVSSQCNRYIIRIISVHSP